MEFMWESKAYRNVGIVVGILVYIGCILGGGGVGFLLGWIPAIIFRYIFDLWDEKGCFDAIVKLKETVVYGKPIGEY